MGTAWGIVELPGRPYVVTAMVTYGDADPDAALRRIADAAWEHFSRIARASGYGVRVPLEFVR